MRRAGSQGEKSRAFFGVGAHLGRGCKDHAGSGRISKQGRMMGDLVSRQCRLGASSSDMMCAIINRHGEDTQRCWKGIHVAKTTE